MHLHSRILKNNIIKKVSNINYLELLQGNEAIKLDLEKLLNSKLDIWLDKESEGWEFRHDMDEDNFSNISGPLSEEELSKFVENTLDVEFFEEFFNKYNNSTEISLTQEEVENLSNYIYDTFDSLYNSIEDRVEEERENYLDELEESNISNPFGPGLSQKDFL